MLEERAREQALSEDQKETPAYPAAKAQDKFYRSGVAHLDRCRGFVLAYNTQLAVEPVLPLIVGQTVTRAGNEKQQWVPVVEKIEEQNGHELEEVLTDSGIAWRKLAVLGEAHDRQMGG